ncbi:MAG: trypsin-like peptidase domain-containing protein [Anaerolineae bacterium]|nr:trypsin-like peptidase domain-containing protein [Anaerolineae bacterium]
MIRESNEWAGASGRKLKQAATGVVFVALALVAVLLVIGLTGVSLFGERPPAFRGTPLSVSPVVYGGLRALQATPTAVAQEAVNEAEAVQQVMINVFGRVDPSVVNIEVSVAQGGGVMGGSGSGFVLDAEGHIATNAHVVRGAQDIWVTFSDGYATEATLIGLDDYADLAVIKVDMDPARLYPVTLGDSRTLQVGQTVIAIGNPFGLRSSMTVGVISATGRALASAASQQGTISARSLYQNPSIIQVDAAINPGNSGGPLLDLHGQVIGINSAIRTESGGFEGIGFAVPVNTLKRIVPQLIENGRAEYSWLGITSISPESSGLTGASVAALADRYNLPVDYGVIITSVTPGSPAAEAGLRGGSQVVPVRNGEITLGGDIIVAVNGEPVRDFDDLMGYLVANTSPGDTVTLTVYRDNQPFDVQVTLRARPE